MSFPLSLTLMFPSLFFQYPTWDALSWWRMCYQFVEPIYVSLSMLLCPVGIIPMWGNKCVSLRESVVRSCVLVGKVMSKTPFSTTTFGLRVNREVISRVALEWQQPSVRVTLCSKPSRFRSWGHYIFPWCDQASWCLWVFELAPTLWVARTLGGGTTTVV